MSKATKRGLIITIIILTIIILGLGGFLIYDKMIRESKVKEEPNITNDQAAEKEETKEVDINSDLVKQLVYPNMSKQFALKYGVNFVLSDENVSNYSTTEKIAMAFRLSDIDDIKTGSDMCRRNEDGSITYGVSNSQSWCYEYSGDVIKANFIKLFGPDTEYITDNLTELQCGDPIYYDKYKNVYYGTEGCGGASPTIKSFSKTYKAIQSGDYLYIYDYAMIYFDPSNFGVRANLFNDYNSFKKFYDEKYMNSNSTSFVDPVISEEEAQQQFNSLVNNGSLNTYEWTFKKQSDDKYYYDSSKWLEN